MRLSPRLVAQGFVAPPPTSAPRVRARARPAAAFERRPDRHRYSRDGRRTPMCLRASSPLPPQIIFHPDVRLTRSQMNRRASSCLHPPRLARTLLHTVAAPALANIASTILGAAPDARMP